MLARLVVHRVKAPGALRTQPLMSSVRLNRCTLDNLNKLKANIESNIIC